MKQEAIRSAVAVAALTLLVGAGKDAPPTDVVPAEVLGNLTCTLGEKVPSETGAEAQKILCVFGTLQSGAEEIYEGVAYFVAGGEKAREATPVMSWIVKGPTTLLEGPGGLEQTYTQGTVESGKEGPLVGKDSTAVALHPRGIAEKEKADAAQAASRASVIDLKLRNTNA